MENLYIKDLIIRMITKVDLLNSSDQSISWKAYREAELLEDENLISDLIQIICAEKNKNKLKSAYFILGKISKNTDSKNALVFLVSRASVESDKGILQVILDSVSDLIKPADLDLSPLINAIDDKRWQVRQAAIRALNHSTHQEAEDRLIKVLIESKENIELLFACYVLNNIGSHNSIIYLENYVKSRNQDLKITSREAIKNIKTRHSINE